MLERHVTLQNALGLHARAAAQLVKLSRGFQSNVILIRPDNASVADAKSILSVLTLAATLGTELILQADGEDEREALTNIESLINRKFGED
jgi:phosphocarrier protein HPr